MWFGDPRGSWPPLFWVVFQSSQFQEGNKESSTSRLNPGDLGLQGLSWLGHPLLKHATNFTPSEDVARRAISGI